MQRLHLRSVPKKPQPAVIKVPFHFTLWWCTCIWCCNLRMSIDYTSHSEWAECYTQEVFTGRMLWGCQQPASSAVAVIVLRLICVVHVDAMRFKIMQAHDSVLCHSCSLQPIVLGFIYRWTVNKLAMQTPRSKVAPTDSQALKQTDSTLSSTSRRSRMGPAFRPAMEEPLRYANM